ncbi:hypothetical protein CEXT_771201 [Caerostris extrusa]|uniref:Uncharacterized protein n=1 Tax=Caerostris extrusa TaxID=172846 RepID=A0AAV4PSA1_CAEEX|nr:hypothetical protein CEXT_771201 [Caerostris extrusa]
MIITGNTWILIRIFINSQSLALHCYRVTLFTNVKAVAKIATLALNCLDSNKTVPCSRSTKNDVECELRGTFELWHALSYWKKKKRTTKANRLGLANFSSYPSCQSNLHYFIAGMGADDRETVAGLPLLTDR